MHQGQDSKAVHSSQVESWDQKDVARMASIVHPAGIWSTSDDENKRRSHGTDAVSTRHASLQTDRQHISRDRTMSATEDKKSPSAAVELTSMQTIRHAQAGRSLPAAGSPTGQPVDGGLAEEHGSPRAPVSQGVSPELPSFAAEIVFVVTCSGGQLVSALLIGHVAVTQAVFGDALGISPSQIPWLLGASMLSCGLTVAAQITIPPLRPARDSLNTEAPSLRHFDYIGAGLASVGCTLIIFGLTQGDSADWNPYTYALIMVGFVMLGVF